MDTEHDTAPQPDQPWTAPPAPSWQALDGRVQAVIVVFVGYAAYQLLVIVSDLMEYSLAGRIAAGDFTTAEVNSSDDRQTLVGIGELLLLIPAAVVWIRWFVRAYDNAKVVAGPQRYGSGWAIGGWFVPFLALWRPKQIANDIWRATQREPGMLLAAWWAAWVIFGLLGNVLYRMDVDTADDLKAQDMLDAVTSVIAIVGLLLAVRVAQRATEGLEARRTV